MTQQEKYIRHMEICKELNQTYIDKNTAYGDSFGKTFKDLGIMSAITRMYDKFNRVTSLAKGADNHVKDEAVEDTLMDLANYAIMTLIELENNKMGKESIEYKDKKTCEWAGSHQCSENCGTCAVDPYSYANINNY